MKFFVKYHLPENIQEFNAGSPKMIRSNKNEENIFNYIDDVDQPLFHRTGYG